MQALTLEEYEAVAGGQIIQGDIRAAIVSILVQKGLDLMTAAMNQLVDYFQNMPPGVLDDVTLFNAMDNFGIQPYSNSGNDADGG